MTTAMRLRSNSLFSPLFGVTLSEEYITKVAKLSSKQDATRTSIWEKIKDWLCGTNKDEIIKKISNLTHNNENLSVESVLEKIKIFYEIKQEIEFNDKFKISFKEEGEGKYAFSIGDRTHTVYQGGIQLIN